MPNYLNPNWLLSRLLEKMGIKTYLEKVELAAHIFAGSAFALAGVLWGWIIPAIWAAWTLIDEFCFDKWKGSDTLWDLGSKLIAPLAFAIWRIFA